jgi:DNA polymerase-3 subunit epsilon
MIIVLDTETTGLTFHPKAPANMQPRVCEFGAVFLDSASGDECGSVSQLINPEIPIPANVTKIHGITDEMVSDAPTFGQWAPHFFAILGHGSVVVAHNLPFDKHILRYECQRYNLDFGAHWPAREFDTIDLYREAWGKDMKLSALYELVTGRKMEKAHRVMPDVNALVEIIRQDRLYEIMR